MKIEYEGLRQTLFGSSEDLQIVQDKSLHQLIFDLLMRLMGITDFEGESEYLQSKIENIFPNGLFIFKSFELFRYSKTYF